MVRLSAFRTADEDDGVQDSLFVLAWSKSVEISSAVSTLEGDTDDGVWVSSCLQGGGCRW